MQLDKNEDVIMMPFMLGINDDPIFGESVIVIITLNEIFEEQREFNTV